MPAPNVTLLSERSPAPPRQGHATVSASGERLRLREGMLEFEASRAASCLLVPELHDRVWFVAAEGEAHVIAVLERAGEGPAQLRVDGEAELNATCLRLRGSESLELETEGRLSARSDKLELRARLAQVALDECTAVLRKLWTHARESTLVTRVRELFTERLTSHAKVSTRSVETIDQLRAGAIEHRAQDTALISAKQTLIQGGQIVKVDGAQIHMG